MHMHDHHVGLRFTHKHVARVTKSDLSPKFGICKKTALRDPRSTPIQLLPGYNANLPVLLDIRMRGRFVDWVAAARSAGGIFQGLRYFAMDGRQEAEIGADDPRWNDPRWSWFANLKRLEQGEQGGFLPRGILGQELPAWKWNQTSSPAMSARYYAAAMERASLRPAGAMDEDARAAMEDIGRLYADHCTNIGASWGNEDMDYGTAPMPEV